MGCYKQLLVLVVFVFCSSVFAQNTDTKLRLGLEIEKDILKDLKASLEAEHRLYKNVSQSDKTFLEPALRYSLKKAIDLGLIWRIMLYEDKEGMSLNKQRYSAYARYKASYLDFDIRFKGILQYGFDDITNPAFNNNQNLTGRYAIDLEYDWFGKKIKPQAKFELFHHLNHPRGNILNQWRLKAGVVYEISKRSTMGLYYMFENEFNVVRPVDAHIWGIKYAFEI